MERNYVVSKRWEKSYPNPIRLRKGDVVIVDCTIKDATPGWDNRVWCLAADGSAGWVPAQILKVTEMLAKGREKALVTENYSALELTVEKGETLVGTRVLNGWVWCRRTKDDAAGWVPSDHLQAV